MKTIKKLSGGVLIGLLALILTGCPHQTAVYNVNNAAIASNKEDLTLKDMRAAIIRAGSSLGWQMEDAGPGKIEGTLHLRSHVAKIDIPYSTSNYSIHYKDSTNLNYDGVNIHSNYNGWIQRLDRSIQVQLKTL